MNDVNMNETETTVTETAVEVAPTTETTAEAAPSTPRVYKKTDRIKAVKKHERLTEAAADLAKNLTARFGREVTVDMQRNVSEQRFARALWDVRVSAKGMKSIPLANANTGEELILIFNGVEAGLKLAREAAKTPRSSKAAAPAPAEVEGEAAAA